MSAEPPSPGPGEIYTETTVYSPPEAFLSEAPYQIAIVQLDAGGRLTARILGEPARIGDRVEFVEFRNTIPFFRKSS